MDIILIVWTHLQGNYARLWKEAAVSSTMERGISASAKTSISGSADIILKRWSKVHGGVSVVAMKVLENACNMNNNAQEENETKLN
jgi:hypothetical protein